MSDEEILKEILDTLNNIDHHVYILTWITVLTIMLGISGLVLYLLYT